VTAADGKLCVILTASDFAAKTKGVPFSRFRFPVFGKWMPETGVRKICEAARARRVSEFMPPGVDHRNRRRRGST
jgi:hypothetical protein